MFPMDQGVLFFLKIFIFVTCICFWIKVIVDAIFRGHGIGKHFTNRHRF